MFTIAATSTTANRLSQIPMEFWIRIGVGVCVLIAVVIALRKLAKVNKAVLFVIVGMILSFVGFSWIYERNEPSWATPAVSWLAGFFPSKGSYDKKANL